MNKQQRVFSTFVFSSALVIGSSAPVWSQEMGTQRSRNMSADHMGAMGHWSRDDVKQVQDALRSKGYDPGSSDGIMGPRTHTALRQFQSAQNLPATGQLDSSTASALGVSLSSSNMGDTSSMKNRNTSSSGGERDPLAGTNTSREGTGPGSPEGRPDGGKLPGSNTATTPGTMGKTPSNNDTSSKATGSDRPDSGSNASREGTGPTSPQR